MSNAPDDIRISADPSSEFVCKFTVDRPVNPDRSYYFASSEQAEGSPLAAALFKIDDVRTVLVAHDVVTVTKNVAGPWQTVGPQFGAAIRAHIASGKPAISDELWSKLPGEDEIREKVQSVLDREINPSVAAHGGVIDLLGVKQNVVYIKMGGGCQGCGMADVTLKQGVERAIRAAIPEVGEILDATDHASGRNPFYAPSKK